MTTTSRSEVADRAAAVKQAEQAVDDAQDRLVQARDALDEALSKRLWVRLGVVANPGSTPVYENILHPGATTALPQVLAAVFAEDRLR